MITSDPFDLGGKHEAQSFNLSIKTRIYRSTLREACVTSP